MERISTSYLEFLTDDFSIWQHSSGKKIDKKHGYALDDAARAMIFTMLYGPKGLIKIYFDFLKNCLENDGGNNFYDKDRNPLPSSPSEDALGQTYWALALWNKTSQTKYSQIRIETMINRFESVRGNSYALIGAVLENHTLAKILQNKLLKIYVKNSSKGWEWIEHSLTYGNAIVPMSFFAYHRNFFDKDVFAAGLAMLDFLNKKTKHNTSPITIGNKGWYRQGQKKSLYDQQPIDIAYQVIANIEAYEITSNYHYLSEAKFYFSWFWGNNILNRQLVDCKTKRCFDGMREKSISRNSGAESIICYLWAQEKIWSYIESTKIAIPEYQQDDSETFYRNIQRGRIS
jgi:hypothetical protein